MFAELRLRTGTNHENVTILRSVSQLAFTSIFGDVGAIQFTLPTEYAQIAGVVDNCIIEVAPNGVSNVPNMWFGIDKRTINKTTDGAKLTSMAGTSIAQWLTDGIIYPSTWPDVPVYNPDGTTATTIQGFSFQNATPGNILQTVIARAAERSQVGSDSNTYATFDWLDATSFTGATTTDSVAWASTLTTIYSNGSTVLDVLKDLVNRNLIDFQFVNQQLQVFNYGTLPVHRTPAEVTFRAGQNVMEQQTATDASNTDTALLIQGDQTAILERTNADAVVNVGRRRERFISQSGIYDIPTLQFVADATLLSTGHVLRAETLGVNDVNVLPWTDYQLGDWVWEDVDGSLTEIQIQQLSASGSDANNLTIGLTLGDLVSDADEKLTLRINNMIGSTGTYGGLPTNVNDFLAPSPPTSVVATPTAYRDSNGIDFCSVAITWAHPTTNVDGSPLVDLNHYDVQTIVGSGSIWSAATTVQANATLQAVFQSLSVGQAFTSRVRAVDNVGNASTWVVQSNTISSLPSVTTPPAKPSVPIVTAGAQILTIDWDGLDNTGTPYSTSFQRIDVQISTDNTFATGVRTVGSFVNTSSTELTANSLSSSLTYYVRFFAYDKSGNHSVASNVSTGTMPDAASFDGGTLSTLSVTGSKIATGTITSSKISSLDASKITPDAPTWVVLSNSDLGTGYTGTTDPDYSPLRYCIDSFNRVTIDGKIDSVSAVTGEITSAIPVGFRPGKSTDIPIVLNTSGVLTPDVVTITTLGEVIRLSTDDGTFSLSNISYIAEA